MVYIQSSGANITWVMRPLLNKGLDYVEDIMKSLGISNFERLWLMERELLKMKICSHRKAKESIDSLMRRFHFLVDNLPWLGIYCHLISI